MTSYERKRRLRAKRRRQRACIMAVLLVIMAAAIALLIWGISTLFGGSDRNDPQKTTPAVTTTTTTPTTRTRAPAPATVQVPMILQNPELPTGCESTAAAMVLQAYGYPVSKTDFAEALPKSRLHQYNGRVYAAHPNKAFIGNPFTGGADFGVFAGVVTDTMQTLIDQAGGKHLAKDITGADEATLLSLLDRKVPICIWATMSMVPVRENSSGWYILDGDTYTDTWFSWPGNEHCLVLIGYNDQTVTVHDPLKGVVKYNRSLFFTRYNDLGRQAVILESY